jgi:hypothetical protein
MYTIGSGTATATDIIKVLVMAIATDRSSSGDIFGRRALAEAAEQPQSKIASARTSMLSRGSTYR